MRNQENMPNQYSMMGYIQQHILNLSAGLHKRRTTEIVDLTQEKNYPYHDRLDVWDNWFVNFKGKLFAYYMQRPRQNLNFEEDIDYYQHFSSIGVAIANPKDLSRWQEIDTAIHIGAEHEWDGKAIWSGGVFEDAGKLIMLYTGRAFKNEWIQRIGLATSTDGIRWEKYPGNPILEADPRFYKMGHNRTADKIVDGWRDPGPFKVKDKKTNKTYALITANDVRVKGKNNGCLALVEAISADYTNWKTHPPLISPGMTNEGIRAMEFEVAKGFFNEDQKRYYIITSTGEHRIAPEDKQKYGITTGVLLGYVSNSDNLSDGFHPVNEYGIIPVDPKLGTYGIPVNNEIMQPCLYGMSIINQKGRNTYNVMGWTQIRDRRTFSPTGILEVNGNKVSVRK